MIFTALSLLRITHGLFLDEEVMSVRLLWITCCSRVILDVDKQTKRSPSLKKFHEIFISLVDSTFLK